MQNHLDHRNIGFYRPAFEHDNSGNSLIAQMDGQVSHRLVKTSIGSLEILTHRGAVAADGKSCDGNGLLLKTPVFFTTSPNKQGFSLGLTTWTRWISNAQIYV